MIQSFIQFITSPTDFSFEMHITNSFVFISTSTAFYLHFNSKSCHIPIFLNISHSSPCSWPYYLSIKTKFFCMIFMFLGDTVCTVYYGAVLQGLSFHIEYNMNSHLEFVKSNNPVIIFYKPGVLLNSFYLHNNIIRL